MLGAVGAIMVGLALSGLVETLVGAVVPDSAGWVKEEAGLWVVSGASALVLPAWLLRSRSHAAASR
jgi:hypothetical protein